MEDLLQNPYLPMAALLLFAGLAMVTLLNSMKSGGNALALLAVVCFALLAAYFAQDAFAPMNP